MNTFCRRCDSHPRARRVKAPCDGKPNPLRAAGAGNQRDLLSEWMLHFYAAPSSLGIIRTVRYLSIDVDAAREMAEQTEAYPELTPERRSAVRCGAR